MSSVLALTSTSHAVAQPGGDVSVTASLAVRSPYVSRGEVWAMMEYAGRFRKICVELQGQTLSGWVSLKGYCTDPRNTGGNIAVTVGCPTRGAFRTWTVGYPNSGGSRVKASSGVYLEC